ncbi:MAG: hypothetical protein FJ312_02340 [SAR202 cluster bacterium]|nr:hypothetical protein [SAR202 cluster bacterium]
MEQSIKKYRESGRLALPQGVFTFPAESELGKVLDGPPAKPQGLRPDLGTLEQWESRLRTYIQGHPYQPAPWDALRLVYEKLHRVMDAFQAVKQAIRLAPDDPEFHFNAAMLCMTPIGNSIRAANGVRGLDPDLDLCTLESLAISFQQALEIARSHLEAAIHSDVPMLDCKKVAATSLSRLPELERIYRY